MRLLLILPVAVMLGGCPWAPKPETGIVTDTFCITSKKRKWSIDRDPPDRIREARIHNEVIDRRCGTGKVS